MLTCLNWARTGPMPVASAQFWPSYGTLWHVYWVRDRRNNAGCHVHFSHSEVCGCNSHFVGCNPGILGSLLISNKTSCHKISRSIEAAMLVFRMIRLLWNLTFRKQCCRGAFKISKRCDNSNHQSRGFETSRDLIMRRLIGYWTVEPWPSCQSVRLICVKCNLWCAIPTAKSLIIIRRTKF